MTHVPEDCDRAFAACVKARDLDGLMALYEPEAPYVRRNGTVVIGQSAIRELLQSLSNVATEIEMNVVRVVALNGIALLYNDWTSKSSSENGGVRESSGRAIEVVRRQPYCRWLFAINDPFGRSRR
jgi:ketosteroid isomerase-like protein